jgi:hypothetical protein
MAEPPRRFPSRAPVFGSSDYGDQRGRATSHTQARRVVRPNLPSDFLASAARRGAASTAALDRLPHPEGQSRTARSL